MGFSTWWSGVVAPFAGGSAGSTPATSVRGRTLAIANLTILDRSGVYTGRGDARFAWPAVSTVDELPSTTPTETVTVTATASATAAPLPSPSPSASARGVNPTLVLAATLGPLLLLSLSALALLLLRRRRRKPPHETFSIESHHPPEDHVQPFVDRRASVLTTRGEASTSSSQSSALGQSTTALAPARSGAGPPQNAYPPPQRKRLLPRPLPHPPLAVRNPTEVGAVPQGEDPHAEPEPEALLAPRVLSSGASVSSLATSLATTLV
ncbi:hypothetical protein Q8F55_002768 [Vanrija albida]|uniref:Uncharacterized protein n=1 Tax=Vanrija albida TaxID=181172 RepID=A0ABR3QAT3_9TREE